ncbi:MAG: T9SS type A sorting domain-containing protein [candidate division Zixibacteria bacterium]|nr:T9SS type A sorting domain-containing protein [candidate division Zixibacteria bacterium]MCI0597201.1 T9SS type A sorting domain-containing protein [candidate division Zixibacteria bacterium]
MDRKLGLAIGLLLFGFQISFSDVAPVKHLAGQSETGQPHLYWFGAAAAESTLFYDDGTAQESIFVAEDWADNQVLVRFGFSEPFYVVSKLLARVSRAPISDTVDYFAFTLHQDTGASRPGPVLIRVPSEARWNGSTSLWSEVNTNVLMTGDTTFWGAFNWAENSPTKPRIGDDRSISLFFRTYIGYQDNYFLWTNGGNLMLRAGVLFNNPAAENVDGFVVYRGADSSSLFPIDTIVSNQFDFLDAPPTGGDYYYRITRWQNGEESQSSNAIRLTASPTAVEDRNIEKHAFLLSEPFPNPTSAGVLFTALTDRQMQLGFSIYNLLGQKVYSKPASGYPAGEHPFYWNGQDASGRRLPSGMYLLRFQAGEEVLVKKVTLLR